jgi:hypothetical protein
MLTDLADGRDTVSPTITQHYLVLFQKVSPKREKLGAPRYEILRSSMEETQSRYSSLAMWLVSLLEKHADRVRRCPHCERIFIQNKRSARFCGQACYSVVSTRAWREKQAKQSKAKKKSLGKRSRSRPRRKG